ncbi:peptidylprolyl isomerase [Lysinibacillus macroides]|uniref:Peptidyl-prolyl cis-trans isomerase n=1 Tax=Lysinibacillus macroides TaxID=33935 RepID=A0A0M9DEV5_9BACI|nr:peptidylprolyl isomerase [Lysinibacillus macroides]KOY80038.1 peptidylprolyl isomerase [Lysinibacillus macroides]QPR67326.1 peptidylprolyl isomerase [Lysinibacillus macroides]
MVVRSKGLLVLLTLVLLLVGCGTTEDVNNGDYTVDYASEVKENPIVTITMNSDEKIVIELEPAVAPNTVANFISLVEKGFYDGLIFHRVIPGFMIQGGDPLGNGTGGPDYSIDGEFSLNGFENKLQHERGVISMARSQDLNSAGSQFFIMVEQEKRLDGEYAAFGKVIEGMETVDAIVAVERDGADKPLEDQQIKKVEVDTKGFDYPAPKVHK